MILYVLLFNFFDIDYFTGFGTSDINNKKYLIYNKNYAWCYHITNQLKTALVIDQVWENSFVIEKMKVAHMKIKVKFAKCERKNAFNPHFHYRIHQ